MRYLTDGQKYFIQMLEAWSTPLVLHPGGWEDTLPKWLQGRAVAERLDLINDGGWNKATDAEICAYLNTASMVAPMDSHWANIYIFETAKQMPQIHDVLSRGSDGRVRMGETLTDYEVTMLNDLKHKIRSRQQRTWTVNKKEGSMNNRQLVIHEKGGQVSVGMIADGCDPLWTVVSLNWPSPPAEGMNIPTTIEEALPYIPQFLQKAEESWKASPKRPAYQPPPAAPKSTSAKPAAKPATTGGKPPTQTDSLPLLAGAKVKEQPVTTPSETVTKPSESVTAATETETKPSEIGKEGELTEAEVQAAQTAVDGQGSTAAGIEKDKGDQEKAIDAPGGSGPGGEAKAEPETPAPADPAAAVSPNSPPPAPPSPSTSPAAAPVMPVTTPASGAPGTTGTGVWEYMLEDGRGPYESVQQAMDGMGLDPQKRPQHNRWDRLSTDLKRKIQRREKMA